MQCLQWANSLFGFPDIVINLPESRNPAVFLPMHEPVHIRGGIAQEYSDLVREFQTALKPHHQLSQTGCLFDAGISAFSEQPGCLFVTQVLDMAVSSRLIVSES